MWCWLGFFFFFLHFSCSFAASLRFTSNVKETTGKSTKMCFRVTRLSASGWALFFRFFLRALRQIIRHTKIKIKSICDCRCKFFFLCCILYASWLPLIFFIDLLSKEVWVRGGGRLSRLARLKVSTASRRNGVTGSPTGPSGRHSAAPQSGSANPLLAEASFIWARHTVRIPTRSATAPPPPSQSELSPAWLTLLPENHHRFQSPWNISFCVSRKWSAYIRVPHTRGVDTLMATLQWRVVEDLFSRPKHTQKLFLVF